MFSLTGIHDWLSAEALVRAGGGGGSRTRVPRAFIRGIYMLSFQFIVVARSPKCELSGFQAS